LFQKVRNTAYLPTKTTLVYDGNCGFCKYWLVKWRKITNQEKLNLEYVAFQDKYQNFPDISLERFKEAVQLIEPNGKVYTGPYAAFYSLHLANKYRFFNRWYIHNKWFQQFSDKAYQLIASNRDSFFTISKLLFGKNPEKPFPFWIIYLVIFSSIFFL
jgi:predicted DCC family thiol-disulfide oxidoreductase YuxK